MFAARGQRAKKPFTKQRSFQTFSSFNAYTFHSDGEARLLYSARNVISNRLPKCIKRNCKLHAETEETSKIAICYCNFGKIKKFRKLHTPTGVRLKIYVTTFTAWTCFNSFTKHTRAPQYFGYRHWLYTRICVYFADDSRFSNRKNVAFRRRSSWLLTIQMDCHAFSDWGLLYTLTCRMAECAHSVLLFELAVEKLQRAGCLFWIYVDWLKLWLLLWWTIFAV